MNEWIVYVVRGCLVSLGFVVLLFLFIGGVVLTVEGSPVAGVPMLVFAIGVSVGTMMYFEDYGEPW